jgi:hypothetical protein
MKFRSASLAVIVATTLAVTTIADDPPPVIGVDSLLSLIRHHETPRRRTFLPYDMKLEPTHVPDGPGRARLRLFLNANIECDLTSIQIIPERISVVGPKTWLVNITPGDTIIYDLEFEVRRNDTGSIQINASGCGRSSFTWCSFVSFAEATEFRTKHLLREVRSDAEVQQLNERRKRILPTLLEHLYYPALARSQAKVPSQSRSLDTQQVASIGFFENPATAPGPVDLIVGVLTYPDSSTLAIQARSNGLDLPEDTSWSITLKPLDYRWFDLHPVVPRNDTTRLTISVHSPCMSTLSVVEFIAVRDTLEVRIEDSSDRPADLSGCEWNLIDSTRVMKAQ